MRHPTLAMLVAASLLAVPRAGLADNPMGYRLLPAQEAANLPRNRGALGMDIERAQQITDDDMTFDIIRVKQVHPGSPGAQAGFKPGDDIIAVDGRVFPSLSIFAAYVGSLRPGSEVSVDYIPARGGPQQAQRITMAVGAAGQAHVAQAGMSTGTKIAIGVGAAALLGCYELGCFSHHAAAAPPQGNRLQTSQRNQHEIGGPGPR